MSGPKVVRIVTREEVLAICRGLLARVDAALDDWTSKGARNDCVDDGAIAEARRRRDQLASLLTADRLMDFQKQAPLEEAYLRSDIEARLAKVAMDRAAARTRERRTADAATELLRHLRAQGRKLDPGLERSLLDVAAGRPDGRTMAAGFALLSSGAEEGRSEKIRTHAGRLMDAGGKQSYADWLAGLPRSASDAAIERLESRLLTISQLAEDDDVVSWTARLREAEREADEARRNLILDDLEVRISGKLRGARELASAREELAAVHRELAVEVPDLAFERLPPGADLAIVQSAIAASRSKLETVKASRAADARRAAVLEGLAGLGYEVTEGMSTSWAHNGHVVVRRAATPDYGVELSGNPDGGRLQMRAVAFDDGSAAHDVKRDVDAETIWCGDVGQLGSSLAGLGGGLVIEKARPVGAVPLKRVPRMGRGLDRTSREGAPPKARSLD